MNLKEYEQYYHEDLRIFLGGGTRLFVFQKMERLPDEHRRVLFLASYFWRALASQIIHSAMPVYHFAFEQEAHCMFIQSSLRQRCTWLLTQSKEKMSPAFNAALLECLKPAMQLMISWCAKVIDCRINRNQFKKAVLHISELQELLRSSPDLIQAFRPEQRVIKHPPSVLASEKQPCPDWLQQLAIPLSPELFKANLRNIFHGSLVYPGAGSDWSPLRQLSGVFHSFVFFDASSSEFFRIKGEITTSAHERLFPYHGHAQLLGSCEVRLESCVSAEQQQQINRRLMKKLEESGDIGGAIPHIKSLFADPGFLCGEAIWCVYECNWGQRISLLYLKQEAILGLAWLRMLTKGSPKGLVLVDHGLGGNFWWQNLGKPYHRFLMRQLKMAAPKWLIAGNDNYHFPDNSGCHYERLLDDACVEAMHKDMRTIFKLRNKKGQPKLMVGNP